MTTPSQDTNPKRETTSEAVWPPAPAAEPPKPAQPPVKLLTGKVWLDKGVGWGLTWLWIFGLGKARSVVENAYTAYFIRVPLSQKAISDTPVLAGLGALALLILGAMYFGLRYTYPVAARSFGWNALIWIVMGFIIGTLWELFP